jgi:hypothetical protein
MIPSPVKSLSNEGPNKGLKPLVFKVCLSDFGMTYVQKGDAGRVMQDEYCVNGKGRTLAIFGLFCGIVVGISVSALIFGFISHQDHSTSDYVERSKRLCLAVSCAQLRVE